MLPVVVQNPGGQVMLAAFIGAVAALFGALIGGVFTYFAAVRKVEAELAAAAANAAAVLKAAKEEAEAVVKAAREQAAGTREAGLRNAIETEAMKLRFRLAERHLDAFHARADALMNLLAQVQVDETAVQQFVDYMARDITLMMVNARQIVRPADWGKMLPMLQDIQGGCISAKYLLETRASSLASPMDQRFYLLRNVATAMGALIHLTSVVSTSSVVYAQEADLEDFAAVLQENWAKSKAALVEQVAQMKQFFAGFEAAPPQ